MQKPVSNSKEGAAHDWRARAALPISHLWGCLRLQPRQSDGRASRRVPKISTYGFPKHCPYPRDPCPQAPRALLAWSFALAAPYLRHPPTCVPARLMLFPSRVHSPPPPTASHHSLVWRWPSFVLFTEFLLLLLPLPSSLLLLRCGAGGPSQ